MPNVRGIQRHINKGYRKIAHVTGDNYEWYRPDLPLLPFSGESYLGIHRAQFATDAGFVFYRPADFPTADRWFGAFEQQKDVLPGDYFVGHLGTFYLTAVLRFTALECIWCNHVLSIGRAQDGLAPGAQTEYSGQSAQNTILILDGWPGSLRQLGSGMKMRGTDMRFPSDAPLGAYGIFLPRLANTPIQWNDIITDDTGRRYVISTLEESDLGWRISAEAWPP